MSRRLIVGVDWAASGPEPGTGIYWEPINSLLPERGANMFGVSKSSGSPNGFLGSLARPSKNRKPRGLRGEYAWEWRFHTGHGRMSVPRVLEGCDSLDEAKGVAEMFIQIEGVQV